MFISTPFVRFTVNRLYRQGKLDQQQRDYLILQDRQINMMISIGALVLIAAYFFR
ncbi:hypothetical protein FIU95_21460 (plasmid) [Microbulbifer sp. THAF38]|uniref:hypothetical protein n=1 Tax=Microbulbifer sp. TRSA002 TaxID=3243382 RepID=UPI0012A9CD0A|nr:hypothetical protein FIU95_21460 [Microbulbifer sp. THAF38]